MKGNVSSVLGLEELDVRQTSLGELILRVRRSPALQNALVYEVKLNDAFLMSSAVNQSEVALANLALEAWGEGDCEVLVGGLGLGCTAATALKHACVKRLDVIEFLHEVIDWHYRRLVPASTQLMDDPRCSLIHGNFFERVGQRTEGPEPRYDIILVDIDHSPDAWLHSASQEFYSEVGLKAMTRHLRHNGVFGLWSVEAPDQLFLDRLERVFQKVTPHEVAYYNPLFRRTDRNVVIIAQQPRAAESEVGGVMGGEGGT